MDRRSKEVTYEMARCTPIELENRIGHLVDTQYRGHTREDLTEAAKSGTPVSFAVYPLEWTDAGRFLYELDLFRLTSDSVRGFVTEIARATYDRYVAQGGIELAADDIYCVDIIS